MSSDLNSKVAKAHESPWADRLLSPAIRVVRAAQDGTKRTAVDIQADDIEFLPSAAGRPDGDNSQSNESNYGSNNKSNGGLTPVDEDDLPF